VLLLLFTAVCGSLWTSAQAGGGQACLQAYADANGNQQRDTGEAPISHSVAASLHDARGLTIQAALLESSPYAVEGLLCFQALEAGQYELRVSSAAYEISGSSALRVSVQPGQPPPRVDVSLQPLQPPVPAAQSELPLAALRRAAIAAGTVVALLLALGMALLMAWLRRGSPAAFAESSP